MVEQALDIADIAEEEAPASFLCPISGELMRDPVMCADGHSYERANIERWLAESRLSPVTGSQLPHGYLLLARHGKAQCAGEMLFWRPVAAY